MTAEMDYGARFVAIEPISTRRWARIVRAVYRVRVRLLCGYRRLVDEPFDGAW